MIRSSARWALWRGAALILALWPFAAWAAARYLLVQTPIARADAIVVLSGSAAYGERTQKAAALYREGYAPRIILTDDHQQGGWSNTEGRNPFFVERARRELERAGVPPEKIESLPQMVVSTHDESRLLRDYARSRGLNSLLVVTSAYHSRRAMWTMRRVFEGDDVRLGFAAVAPGGQTPPASTWWLHSRGWQAVAGEYVKLAYYWLLYS
ncbi:MAG: YdcF family protein [Pyrinomonadaceae bacterium]